MLLLARPFLGNALLSGTPDSASGLSHGAGSPSPLLPRQLDGTAEAVAEEADVEALGDGPLRGDAHALGEIGVGDEIEREVPKFSGIVGEESVLTVG